MNNMIYKYIRLFTNFMKSTIIVLLVFKEDEKNAKKIINYIQMDNAYIVKFLYFNKIYIGRNCFSYKTFISKIYKMGKERFIFQNNNNNIIRRFIRCSYLLLLRIYSINKGSVKSIALQNMEGKSC